MNKNLIYIFALICLYGLIFALSSYNMPYQKDEIVPFALEAICLDQDLPISLTAEGESICFDQKKTIYTLRNGERYELYSLIEEEQFLSAGPNFILTQLSENLVISTFNKENSIITSKNILLLENEAFISRFYNSESAYISTVIEVDSPESIKCRIIKLTFSNLSEIKIEEHRSTQMYKVTSIIEEDQLIIENPYAFLEPYKYSLEWKSKKEKELEIDQNEEEDKYIINQTSFINISKEKSLLYTREKSEPIALLKYFSSEQLPSHIGTLYSKNDKTVYNCNDFGESEQITLRVCIPEK